MELGLYFTTNILFEMEKREFQTVPISHDFIEKRELTHEKSVSNLSP